jgi:allantoin racemase
MRIWMQMVSSQARLPNFLLALQQHANSVVAADTEVLVRGTTYGALGDQHALFLHFDVDEVIRLAHAEVDSRKYAVYALANSLDPGLDALRELLDIPVLSLMQVGCSVAGMLGDRFGLVVPNDKIRLIYARLVASYGMRERLAGVGHLGFDRIADQDLMFTDDDAADRAIDAIRMIGAGLVRQGAETLMVPGPSGLLLARHGVREIEGAPIIDLYSTLIKVSESIGFLADRCGMRTSRSLRYQRPPESLIAEAARLFGL